MDTFLRVFSCPSGNSTLFVRSWFLLNALNSAIIPSPNFLNRRFMKFVYDAGDSSEGSSRLTICIYVWIRAQDHYECPEIRFIPVKISSFQIIKKWQQAVFFCFFFLFHTKNSWNMACEKCARWPSYRRCRGGINLITASNIHLANISRLETQAQKWQARLAGSLDGKWQ